MTTMTETIFNQSFFAEHFAEFEQIFNEQDAHTESFYIGFYDDFIYGTAILSDEDKEGWMTSWKEDFEGEDYDFTLSFDEFIDENEFLKEDVACCAIGDYESLKSKAIPQLFFHISEMWSEESIQDAIDEINAN